MDILRTMAILTEYPFLAFLPAMVFAVLYAVSKSRFVIAASIFWLAYLFYEYGMKFRIFCSGECNIRIDLLVLYPILVLLSLAALAIFSVTVWRKSDNA